MTAREADNVTELPTNAFTDELGVSGSADVATHIYSDFLTQLQGRKALSVYREMGANDATVGSILFAVEMMMRGVDWQVKPASEDPADLAAAQFLTENLAGLNHPFSDTVAQMSTATQYGFSFHETVYDRREDGRVVWHKFAFRPQTTLLKWLLDDRNDPIAFVQAVDSDKVVIPFSKGLHFRIDTATASGRSLLRRAYRSWFFKKRNEEKLQIAIDRNLNGIPMFEVPPEVIEGGAGDARYDTIKKIVTRTRRDEQSGLIIPLEYDSMGNPKYKFSLLSPPHPTDFSQAVTVIRMYAADIANVVLAQFTNLGRDSVGSRALAEPQQDLFQSALEAILDTMQDTVNRQAVQPLFELNPGIVPEGNALPLLIHGDVRDVDLKQNGQFLKDAAQAGFMWPFEDPELARQIIQQAGYEIDPETEQVRSND